MRATKIEKHSVWDQFDLTDTRHVDIILRSLRSLDGNIQKKIYIHIFHLLTSHRWTE